MVLFLPPQLISNYPCEVTNWGLIEGYAQSDFESEHKLAAAYH